MPPEPASAGAARRLVLDALAGLPEDEVVDPAILLVSELVTNAVLHAGTEIEVSVRVTEGCARVEVVDGSHRLPTRKHYDRSAMTGRGLGLVEAAAENWGISSHPRGKSVWFELATEGASSAERADGAPPVVERPHVVRFEHLPVSLVWATVQYGDALIREVALLSFSEDLPGDRNRWQSPELDLGGLLEQVEPAVAAGTAFIDIDVAFCDGADADAVLRLALIDEADRYAHDDQLLIVPGLPEVSACRTWLLREIVRQIEGHPPTPWALPAQGDAATRGPRVTLSDEERAGFTALEVATVVADESNHILVVNAAAAEMLGWAAADLQGRRLTTIIPPELREAHLAGYTRYLLTGEAHVIGTPVRVTALRRDGSQLDVMLEIRVVRSRPHVFAASLRPV